MFVADGLLRPRKQPKTNEIGESELRISTTRKLRQMAGDRLRRERRFFSCCVLGQAFGHILDATMAGEALDGKPVVCAAVAKANKALAKSADLLLSTEEKHLKRDSERAERKRRLPG